MTVYNFSVIYEHGVDELGKCESETRGQVTAETPTDAALKILQGKHLDGLNPDQIISFGIERSVWIMNGEPKK